MSGAGSTDRVVVVGSGLMGTGIAHGFAAAGFVVTLVDLDGAALERAVASIGKIFADGVRLGKVPQAAAESALARLTTDTSLTAALTDRPAVLLVETATESAETLAGTYTVTLFPLLAVTGTTTVKDIRLPQYMPYLESALASRISRGTLSLTKTSN